MGRRGGQKNQEARQRAKEQAKLEKPDGSSKAVVIEATTTSTMEDTVLGENSNKQRQMNRATDLDLDSSFEDRGSGFLDTSSDAEQKNEKQHGDQNHCTKNNYEESEEEWEAHDRAPSDSTSSEDDEPIGRQCFALIDERDGQEKPPKKPDWGKEKLEDLDAIEYLRRVQYERLYQCPKVVVAKEVEEKASRRKIKQLENDKSVNAPEQAAPEQLPPSGKMNQTTATGAGVQLPADSGTCTGATTVDADATRPSTLLQEPETTTTALAKDQGKLKDANEQKQDHFQEQHSGITSKPAISATARLFQETSWSDMQRKMVKVSPRLFQETSWSDMQRKMVSPNAEEIQFLEKFGELRAKLQAEIQKPVTTSSPLADADAPDEESAEVDDDESDGEVVEMLEEDKDNLFAELHDNSSVADDDDDSDEESDQFDKEVDPMPQPVKKKGKGKQHSLHRKSETMLRYKKQKTVFDFTLLGKDGSENSDGSSDEEEEDAGSDGVEIFEQEPNDEEEIPSEDGDGDHEDQADAAVEKIDEELQEEDKQHEQQQDLTLLSAQKTATFGSSDDAELKEDGTKSLPSDEFHAEGSSKTHKAVAVKLQNAAPDATTACTTTTSMLNDEINVNSSMLSYIHQTLLSPDHRQNPILIGKQLTLKVNQLISRANAMQDGQCLLSEVVENGRKIEILFGEVFACLALLEKPFLDDTMHMMQKLRRFCEKKLNFDVLVPPGGKKMNAVVEHEKQYRLLYHIVSGKEFRQI
ncbi:unnamed protein product [Amoebophrya sp. A120]|nr:unnamed protein product [Amoebophrya sp. A120]|eukprot:GSA120T00014020001.1